MNDLFPLGEFEKEIAKSMGEESAKSLFGFINSILDPPAKELGEILKDKLKFYRLKNQIKILKKAQELVGSKQIIAIEPKLLGTVLDSGGLEDNDSMQEKWAALLANSITATNIRADLGLSFAEMLKQLSSFEAKILDALFSKSLSLHDSVEEDSKHICQSEFKSSYKIEFYDDVDFRTVRDNLARMNLVQEGRDEWHIRLTSLGYNFLENVTPEEKQRNMNWASSSIKLNA